jgi:hypothetical protein
VSKASSEEEDSDSDELHVDMWFFGCGNGIKESVVVGREEGRKSVYVRLDVSVFVWKESEAMQSRLPKMGCCEVGSCVTEHLPEVWLAAEKFVHFNNGVTSGKLYLCHTIRRCGLRMANNQSLSFSSVRIS